MKMSMAQKRAREKAIAKAKIEARTRELAEAEANGTAKQKGRPSKYDEEMHCQLVRQMMGEGKSLAAVAAKIGVSRKVLDEWRSKHENFGRSCDAGKEDAQRWWETLATIVATGKAHAKFENPNDPQAKELAQYKMANPRMIQFLMSRRFPDYHAKNHTILQDATMNNVSTDDEVRKLTAEERKALIGRYKKLITQLENDGDE